MKTLVIGASEKPERYSYKAVKLLKKHNHEVIALAKRKGKIDDTRIVTELDPQSEIHTVTIYLSAKNQEEYYQKIIELKPNRIIFNPGTENEELKNLAQKNNIETVENCTLVMLNSNIF